MLFRSSVRIAANGAENETARLGPGAFFGEMSLLTGSPRQATVTAVGSCELLVIDHDAFERLLADHPEVARLVSVKVTERRNANLESVEHTAKEPKNVIAEESEDLVARIRNFFGLRRLSD